VRRLDDVFYAPADTLELRIIEFAALEFGVDSGLVEDLFTIRGLAVFTSNLCILFYRYILNIRSGGRVTHASSNFQDQLYSPGLLAVIVPEHAW